MLVEYRRLLDGALSVLHLEALLGSLHSVVLDVSLGCFEDILLLYRIQSVSSLCVSLVSLAVDRRGFRLEFLQVEPKALVGWLLLGGEVLPFRLVSICGEWPRLVRLRLEHGRRGYD